jgi:protein-tyrosine-phosphatase/predicted ATP-grasp superfamily ATP-dependent carboligase
MSRRSDHSQYRVLVLDGHSKAAAETVRALPRGCVIHVAARDRSCVAFASARVGRHYDQPVTSEALLAWTLARDAEHDYHLIVPSTEFSLLALKGQGIDARVRRKLVIPDESSIDVALDKQLTVELADTLGVPAPDSRSIARRDEVYPRSHYPTVIKPLHSKVLVRGRLRTLAARICADEAEREAALEALLPLAPVVEQAYFAGRGIGVEALFDQGRLCWLFAHERIHELPLTGGASTYRRSIEVPEKLHVATVRLLTHLRWHGVAMVEFKVAPDGSICLIEINPRLWGSLPLATAAGINFPAGLLGIALGQSQPVLPDYRRDYYMRDVPRDAFWFTQAWRQRGNPLNVSQLRARDFATLLRPLWGAEGWDLFDWREPEMWFADVRASARKLTSRLIARGHARQALQNSQRNWRNLRGTWQAGELKRVLVVCTGNICRSPVVERLLAAASPDLEVRSAGVHPIVGRPPPERWTAVVKDELGVSLRHHRSAEVDAELLDWAQLVIIMDGRNWGDIHDRPPVRAERIVLLAVAADAPEGLARSDGAVVDPIDMDEDAMRVVARELAHLTSLLARQSIATDAGSATTEA